MNVIQTFPVQVENKVTNKAGGDSFTFFWASAGPGGFTSSVPAGTIGGVGAKWIWTTNQSVFSYTGNNCANDVCFTQTGGPDPIPSTCSLLCLDDGVALTVGRGASASETALSWPGGVGPFTVFRSTTPQSIGDAGNALATTSLFQYTDAPPVGSIVYYQVRPPVCLARKACSSDADCSPATTAGMCVSRGPFGVPGRSLLASNVTVSSASLTSSLITFFSPPQEIFRVTERVDPVFTGIAFRQDLTNLLPVAVNVIKGAYPPDCCVEPDQLNCDGTCFDYLTDNANCGNCGNNCGDAYHCDSGTCRITCTEDTIDCDGVCVDPKNDRNNCGGCGITCDSNAVCVGAGCFQCASPNDIICGNECINPDHDPHNCGACGVNCDLLCEAPQVGGCDKEGCFCTSPGLALVSTPGPMVPSTPHLRESAPHPLAPAVAPPAPICELPSTTTLVPPGGTVSECELQGFLAKEVPTSIAVCGVGIPDGNARCGNGDPATQGTFMKLVPDLTKPIGNAYVTPFAVHVTDVSNDGLIQAGETVQLILEVLNAGPSVILDANAALVSPPVDLTDDGVGNPVGVTISPGSAPFGDIVGPPFFDGDDCTTVRRELSPAKNLVPYEVTFPLSHPGGVSREFTAQFAGIVDGSPFSMDMPISLGVADTCVFSEKTRGFDGLDGLLAPMAKLVPLGDDPPLPPKNFKEDQVIPLELHQTCGGTELTDEDVDAPQITGLDEVKLGPLDIRTLIINDDTGTSDPFFVWNADLGTWVFHLRTEDLAIGKYTLKIRIASRKEYIATFIIESND